MTRIFNLLSMPVEGLSLMRRGLGALCALDALLRVGDAGFYLSDLGMLPRNLYYSFFEQSWAWSVFHLSGYPEFCVFLLILTSGLGLLQLAGRGTRASRVALWVLMLSVQNRNPAITDAYDDLLRLMLFWDLFLPDSDVSEKKVVSPATVGWQWQLSMALVCWALALGWDEVRLSVQWSGRPSGLDLVPLYRYAQVSLGFLALSVWLKPIRLPALILAVPTLVGLAVELHPLLPLGFAVAALSLWERPGRGESSSRKVGSGLAWTATTLICLVVLLLNVLPDSRLRSAVVPIGQGLGLLQDWRAYYPLGESDVSELVARASGRPVWNVTGRSSRRDRLFAQRVARNPSWAVGLSVALQRKLRLPMPPEVWMRKETLRKDFSLSSVEVELLSATPVAADTRRQMSP